MQGNFYGVNNQGNVNPQVNANPQGNISPNNQVVQNNMVQNAMVGQENVIRPMNNQNTAVQNVAAPVNREVLQEVNTVNNNAQSSGVMDPLNNARNPIPVNPVAPVEDKKNYDDVKVTPMFILTLFFDIIKKPGTTLTSYIEKYQGTKTSFTITMFLTVFSLIVGLLMSVITGGFIKNYNVTTGSYTTKYDINGIFTQNYLRYLLIALLVSGGLILIVSLVYYGASFFNSKGVSLGKCLMVSNISFFPLIMGVNVLYPLGNIVSFYVGFALLGISIICTFVFFITGINECFVLTDINKRVIYNLVNLSIIFLVIITFVFIFFYGEFSFIPTNVGF